MKFPNIGDVAPDFTLQNQDGEKISLQDFKGKIVAVYFYPRASTPGCTLQACGIRDSRKELEQLNAIVLGISPDPLKRLANFTKKRSLNFDLLSDEDHTVADKYGVWGPKKFMGREFDGIHRITFIVAPDGRLKHIMDQVKTKTHHADLINCIKKSFY